MPATLTLTEIRTISILAGETFEIDMGTTDVWKIESVGIGGTSGSIVLMNEELAGDVKEIAVLYTAVNNQLFSSPLPYWLEPGFKGKFSNNSSYTASVSLTIYDFS